VPRRATALCVDQHGGRLVYFVPAACFGVVVTWSLPPIRASPTIFFGGRTDWPFIFLDFLRHTCPLGRLHCAMGDLICYGAACAVWSGRYNTYGMVQQVNPRTWTTWTTFPLPTRLVLFFLPTGRSMPFWSWDMCCVFCCFSCPLMFFFALFDFLRQVAV